MEETVSSDQQHHHSGSADNLQTLIENYSTEIFSDEELTDVLAMNNTFFSTNGPMESYFGKSLKKQSSASFVVSLYTADSFVWLIQL